MNRRQFLALVAGAPFVASLKPWRAPAQRGTITFRHVPIADARMYRIRYEWRDGNVFAHLEEGAGLNWRIVESFVTRRGRAAPESSASPS